MHIWGWLAFETLAFPLKGEVDRLQTLDCISANADISIRLLLRSLHCNERTQPGHRFEISGIRRMLIPAYERTHETIEQAPKIMLFEITRSPRLRHLVQQPLFPLSQSTKPPRQIALLGA